MATNASSGLKHKAADNTAWPTTDEKLYKDAKQSYDRIIGAFNGKPRVFKIPSLKDRVWKANEEQERLENLRNAVASPESSAPRKTISRKKQREKAKKQSDDEGIDGTSVGGETAIVDIADTTIDPFQIGTTEQIWKEKLSLLEKLTPREDLDGYEYREDYLEQQTRFMLQNAYADQLKAEIQRREQYPTDIEQVEDVLFDLVERVVTKVNADMEESVIAKVEQFLSTRHPATRACKLNHLQTIESEVGDVAYIWSDLEYQDIVLTPSGLAVAPTIPYKTLLLHDQEREYAKLLKKREEDDREAMRRKPLTQKLRSAIAKAKVDKNEAVREALRSIVDTAVVLPSRPIRNAVTDYLRKGKNILTKLSADPLDTFQEFLQQITDKVEALREAQAEANYKPDLSNAKALVEEAKRALKGKESKSSVLPDATKDNKDTPVMGQKPVELPDAVMVTLKINFEVPPAYVIRHRRTVQLEWEKLSKRAREIAVKYHLIEDETKKAKKSKAITTKDPSLDQKPIPVVVTIADGDAAVKSADVVGITPEDVPQSQGLVQLAGEKKEGEDEEEEEEKEDEEAIPLKRIVGSRSFSGYLKPDDMITPKVKTDEKHKNDPVVRDSSLRDHFEHEFIDQLAYSCGIPIENIKIEQIRRLEPDNKELLNKIEEKKIFFEDKWRQRRENEVVDSVRRLVRKAFAKGILLDEDTLMLTEMQQLRSSNMLPPLLAHDDGDDHSTVLAGLHLLDDQSTIATSFVEGDDGEQGEAEELIVEEVKRVLSALVDRVVAAHDGEDPGTIPSRAAVPTTTDPLPDEENLRQVVSTVLHEIIDIIEKTDEIANALNMQFETGLSLPFSLLPSAAAPQALDDDSSTLNFSVSMDSRPFVPSLTENQFQGSALANGEEHGSHRSGRSSRHDDDSSFALTNPTMSIFNPGASLEMSTTSASRFGMSQPSMPKSMDIGITNPSLLLEDDSYWLSRTFKARTEDTKRRYRIRKLVKLRDYYYKQRRGKLYALFQDAKTEFLLEKEDFLEDVHDYLEPLLKYIDDMLEVVRPEMLKFKIQLAYALKLVIAFSYQALKEAQRKHQGLQQLLPVPTSYLPKRLIDDTSAATSHPPALTSGGAAADTREGGVRQSTEDEKDNDDDVRTEVRACLADMMAAVESRHAAVPVASSTTSPLAIPTNPSELHGPSVASPAVKSDEGAVSDVAPAVGVSAPLQGGRSPDTDEAKHQGDKEENGVKEEAANEEKPENDEEEEEEEDGEEEEEEEGEEEEEEEQATSSRGDLSSKRSSERGDDEPVGEEEEDNEDEEDAPPVEGDSDRGSSRKSNNDGGDVGDEGTGDNAGGEVEDGEDGGEDEEEDGEDEENGDEEEEEEGDEEEEEEGEGDGEEKGDQSEANDGEEDVDKTAPDRLKDTSDVKQPSSGNQSPQASPPSPSSPASSSMKATSPGSSGRFGRTRERYQVRNLLHPAKYSPAERIALVTEIMTKEYATIQEETPAQHDHTLTDDHSGASAAANDAALPAAVISPHDVAHERTMSRIRKLNAFDAEVIDCMEALLLSVEETVLRAPSETSLQDQGHDAAADDKRWKKMTFGSEITVVIQIRPEQRQLVEGLAELRSEDVAYFLQQQCQDPFSVLNQGTLTQHIVDVSFKPMFRMINAVSPWSTYWIQRIHPSFFNYTATKRYDLKTGKTIKPPKEVRFAADGTTNNINKDIKVVNPLETLDERSKEAFMALNKKPVLLPPGERLKRYEHQPDAQAQVASDVIDFDVDEFGKEFKEKGVQMYRPNMETLTDKDVRRCQRVYQAFKDLHDQEMSRGLVNNGLLPSQYQAKKDMETAFRIYRSARQKMQQNQRRRQKMGLEIDEFAPPPLHVTNISQALFDTWVEEVKEEDRIRLQAKREQKEKMKEALQLEAELRRDMEKRKYWVLENFVRFYVDGKPRTTSAAATAATPTALRPSSTAASPSKNEDHRPRSSSAVAAVGKRGGGGVGGGGGGSPPSVPLPPLLKERTPTVQFSLSADDNDSAVSFGSALQYSVDSSAVGEGGGGDGDGGDDVVPISVDYRVRLPTQTEAYYRFVHDVLELNAAIAKQMDQVEKERTLLMTHAPKVDDGVNKLSDEEKRIIALHDAEVEKKKVIISEEKRTRRLFGLLVRWEKACHQPPPPSIVSPDGHSQSLSKRIFFAAGGAASPGVAAGGIHRPQSPTVVMGTPPTKEAPSTPVDGGRAVASGGDGPAADGALSPTGNSTVASTVSAISQPTATTPGTTPAPAAAATQAIPKTPQTTASTTAGGGASSKSLAAETDGGGDEENDRNRSVAKADIVSFLVYILDCMEKGAGGVASLSTPSTRGSSHHHHHRGGKSRQQQSRQQRGGGGGGGAKTPSKTSRGTDGTPSSHDDQHQQLPPSESASPATAVTTLKTSSSMPMLPAPLRSAPAMATSTLVTSASAQRLTSKTVDGTPGTTAGDVHQLSNSNADHGDGAEEILPVVHVTEDPELGAMFDTTIGKNVLPTESAAYRPPSMMLPEETPVGLSRMVGGGGGGGGGLSSLAGSPTRRSVGVPVTWQMTAEDWELVQGIQWIAAVREQLPLLECLRYFPTTDVQRVTRDELSQWAAIMVHIQPLFSRAVSKLNEEKLQAEQALGIKSEKLSRNRSRRFSSTDDGDDDDDVEGDGGDGGGGGGGGLTGGSTRASRRLQAEEAKRRAEDERLEEIRRTAEREKAWFMAHPHKFVHPKGQKDAPTFCLICRAKAHEYWLKCHDEAEKTRLEGIEDIFNAAIEAKEEGFIDVIEQEQGAQLETTAQSMVEKALIREGVVDLPPGDDDDGESPEDHERRLMRLLEEPAAPDALAVWEAKMKKIRAYLCRQNVPLVDPRGKALIPKKPPKKLRAISVRPTTSSSSNANLLASSTKTTAAVTRDGAEDSTMVDPTDLDAVRAHTALKFRVYHRDPESLEKAIFLGACDFAAKDLLDPPKGFRTFKLKPESVSAGGRDDDDQVSSMVGGSIALMIRLTTHTRKDGTERYHWRVTLKKLSKLPQVDKHRLTNPFVEVFWRGEAERYQRPAYIAAWTLVAQSKTKYETIDAEFNDREYHDQSLFELPPLWSDLPIPGRGRKETDVCVDGGYIAKNWQPLVDEHHRAMQEAAAKLAGGDGATRGGRGLLATGGGLGTSSLDEIRHFRQQRQYKELLAQEVKIAVEAERYLLALQEKERLLMAKEERLQRCRDDTIEQALYAEDLAVQERYAIDFQRLLEYVVAPSPLLARLRFLMGEVDVPSDSDEEDDDQEDEEEGSSLASSPTKRKQKKTPKKHQQQKQRSSSGDDASDDKDKAKDTDTEHAAVITDTLLASLTAVARPYPKPKHASSSSSHDETSNASPSTPQKQPNNNNNNGTAHPMLSPGNTTGTTRRVEGTGSMRVLCEDPSTGDLLRVVVLPVVVPSDEASVQHHAMTLAGMRPCALTRILDVAVHDIRSYNAQGFTAVQERHAVVIMEYVNGPTFGRHLFDHWDGVTNAMLRQWLLTIVEALAYLHSEGLTHRNLSPRAFIVQTPSKDQLARAQQQQQQQQQRQQRQRTQSSPTAAATAAVAAPRMALSSRATSGRGHPPSMEAKATQDIRIRLQEYWFLENPRSATTGGSGGGGGGSGGGPASMAQGRGAWGCWATAPPEVRNPALYQQHAYQQLQQQQQQQYLVQTRQLTSAASTTSPIKRAMGTSSSSLLSSTTTNRITSAAQLPYITDKSDIFALGVCVFFWVTKGTPLPMEHYQHGHVDALERFLPLKWRPWVMIVLRMTLSLNPGRRATAQELVTFLAGQTGN